MFSSFLYAVLLAGIFAAVAELLLPSRIFSVGRLLRAVICVFIVAFIVSPVLHLVRNDEFWELGTAEPSEGETGEATHSPDTVVFAEAVRLLQENLQESADTLFSEEVKVRVLYREDINTLVARIYCDDPVSERAEGACQTLSAQYGVECTMVSGEKNE